MLVAKRWFLSFLVSVTCYAAYGWLVAPLFEPPPLKAAQGRAPVASKPKRTRSFDHLFPPEAWQRSVDHPPKVIETDKCTVLLQDYQPVGDGQMEINPCTIIFYMGEPTESQQPGDEGKKRHTVVLDTADGAVLVFDRELDLARGEFGKLLGGKLRGEISVYSPPTRTDQPDDLELKTRNVQIDEERIWTPHEVAFRYGNSYGSGRDLSIQLLNEGSGGGGKAPGINGLSTLQLSQVDKIHIDLTGANLFMDEGEEKPQTPSEPQPPVEVRCKGPLRYDFVQRLAAFDDRVEVSRIHPLGPPDKLLCQRLTFLMRDPKAPLPPSAKQEGAAGKTAEKLRRVTAEGNPAVIQGPSMAVEVRAAKIDYDLDTGRVVLAPSPSVTQVMMQYQGSDMSAHQIEYELGAAGQIGRLWAEGPGTLKYIAPQTGKGPDRVTAQWQRELRIRPHEKNQVFSLLGQARVNVGEMGSFAADEMHLWAVESPAPAAATPAKKKGAMPAFSSNLTPDRLLALRNVQIDSPRLTASTERLEAWFTSTGPAATPVVTTTTISQPGAVAPSGSPATSSNVATNAPTSPLASSANPFFASAGQPTAGSQGMVENLQPTSRYDVLGDLIRLQWLMAGATPQTTTLSMGDLSVEGNVRITEIETAKPDEEPLVITGTAVQARNASAPNGSLQLIGKPAKMSGRGVSLSGAVVNVDKGQNRAWIDGPGQATLPIPANMAMTMPGQKPKEPDVSAVAAPPVVGKLTWKGGLNFDGQTVTVLQDVSLVSDAQNATAQSLEVTLARRFSFAETQSKDPPEAVRLFLDGGVALENVSPDPKTRETASRDLLRTRNLMVNRITGELKADGPGWVSTTRRGTALPPAQGAGAPAVAPLAPMGLPLGSDKSGLSYLYVEFEQGIVGNINQHRVRFVGKVRTVFGPVADFEQRLERVEPEQLSEQTVLLNCDDLHVIEMVFPHNQRWMELIAMGNAEVEGKAFNAKANRIGYSTEKEQLVLEGDGRSDAQLWYRTAPGKPRGYAAMRKIIYWRSNNQVDLEGAREINLDQLQGIALPNGPSKR